MITITGRLVDDHKITINLESSGLAVHSLPLVCRPLQNEEFWEYFKPDMVKCECKVKSSCPYYTGENEKAPCKLFKNGN